MKIIEDTEDNDKVIIKIPVYAFQKYLEPFTKEAGMFSYIKEQPLGVVLHGPSETGKTSTAYRIAKETGMGCMAVRDPREISQHYKDEQIILFDEINEKLIKKYSEFIGNLITEIDTMSPKYYGIKKIKWPRKVLLTTNKDVTRWEWPENLRNRLIFIETKDKEEEFVYRRYEGVELKELNLNDIKRDNE